jgi:hypothetical protein
MNVIKVQNGRKWFESKNETKQVLNEFDMSVPRGVM